MTPEERAAAMVEVESDFERDSHAVVMAEMLRLSTFYGPAGLFAAESLRLAIIRVVADAIRDALADASLPQPTPPPESRHAD